MRHPRIRPCGRSLLTCVTVALATAAAALPASAKTYHVRQDGSGEFSSITRALQVAQAGDELVVGPGEWREGTLKIRSSVSLIAEDGPEFTFLDGGGSSRVLDVTGRVELDITGFTIRNGRADRGAGVLAADLAVVTATKCVLRDNVATAAGGAAYADWVGTRLLFRNCDLLGNTASEDAGAATARNGARLEFEECRIHDNKSAGGAGAVSGYDQVIVKVRGCELAGNSGATGGALTFDLCSAVVSNNTFHANSSGEATAVFRRTFSFQFARNIVSGERRGHGLAYLRQGSVGCNIFHGNRQSAVQVDAPDLDPIREDPCFCDADRYDFGVCAASPALAQLDDCGLIGARGLECGITGQVATEPTSWGALKSMFR